MKGIDVSKWQGRIDWNKVKDKIDFAILRAGYGRLETQKDTTFEQNYKGCTENKIPCGAYWYSYAKTPEEAEKEAEVFLNVIKGKSFEYPIFFDVEEQNVLALGKEKVSAIINAALAKIEKAGYWAGLYMSSYWLKTVVDEQTRKRYAVWVAHYDVTEPSYDGEYGIWQYSSKGKVDGINGDVDLNIGYKNYPELIRKANLNNLKFDELEKNENENSITIAVTIGNDVYGGTLFKMEGE